MWIRTVVDTNPSYYDLYGWLQVTYFTIYLVPSTPRTSRRSKLGQIKGEENNPGKRPVGEGKASSVLFGPKETCLKETCLEDHHWLWHVW